MLRLRLPAAVLLAVALLGTFGCGEPSLDSPEYGEIIHQVPPHLDKPFPLPELQPGSITPAPGPQSSDAEPTGPESVPK